MLPRRGRGSRVSMRLASRGFSAPSRGQGSKVQRELAPPLAEPPASQRAGSAGRLQAKALGGRGRGPSKCACASSCSASGPLRVGTE